jgi:hypothetical protein
MKKFFIIVSFLIGCSVDNSASFQYETTTFVYPESGMVVEIYSELGQYRLEHYAGLVVVARDIVRQTWAEKETEIPQTVDLNHLFVGFVPVINKNPNIAGFTSLSDIRIVQGVRTNPIYVTEYVLQDDYRFVWVMAHEIQHVILAGVPGVSWGRNSGHDHPDFWSVKLGDHSMEMEYQRLAFYATGKDVECAQDLMELENAFDHCPESSQDVCQNDVAYAFPIQIGWCVWAGSNCIDAFDFAKGCWPMFEQL